MIGDYFGYFFQKLGDFSPNLLVTLDGKKHFEHCSSLCEYLAASFPMNIQKLFSSSLTAVKNKLACLLGGLLSYPGRLDLLENIVLGCRVTRLGEISPFGIFFQS